MGQSYRDLIARQKAMQLVLDIYTATRPFPKDETFGLPAQVRRAAVAIPVNIAEGQPRYSTNEFYHYLGRARGAPMEVETELMLARDLGYISEGETSRLLGKTAEVSKIVSGLASAIKPAA
jgi:four helix bundle protein